MVGKTNHVNEADYQLVMYNFNSVRNILKDKFWNFEVYSVVKLLVGPSQDDDILL